MPSRDCAANWTFRISLLDSLVLRGVSNPESAHRFLNPALDQLHDPYLLADMKPAVTRLRARSGAGREDSDLR